jgi:hypothetical protein
MTPTMRSLPITSTIQDTCGSNAKIINLQGTTSSRSATLMTDYHAESGEENIVAPPTISLQTFQLTMKKPMERAKLTVFFQSKLAANSILRTTISHSGYTKLMILDTTLAKMIVLPSEEYSVNL